MGVRWLALVAAMVAGCSLNTEEGDLRDATGLRPAEGFGCEDAGGYTVSPYFRAEERAAIEAGAARWNADPSHAQVHIRTGERARCGIVPPMSPIGLEAHDPIPPSHGATATFSRHNQAFAPYLDRCSDAGCRERLSYWGFATLAGETIDMRECIIHARCG